jgi:DNA repair protein RecO (recombination protein O)
MAIHYRTQGLILKKSDLREADRLFTIYTKDFGKLEILGKAIRKIKSKLRGGANLFYLSEIEFIQGKTHKTLTDVMLIDNFKNIRGDLGRLRIAYRVTETLDDMTPKEESDRSVWRLLIEVFTKLNSLKKIEIIYYYFFWNLVSVLGYLPELQKDSLCGKKIDADLAKILKLILKKDWQILARLKIEPRHLKLLKDTSEWYNKEICGIN